MRSNLRQIHPESWHCSPVHSTGGKVMLRAVSVCAARKASSLTSKAASSLASMATANSAANAALFAVAMLANEDAALLVKLDAFRAAQTETARNMTLPPVL